MRTLFALWLVGALGFAANLPAPRERAFGFEYALTVKDVPSRAHTVDNWLPAPHDDAFQRIPNLRVDTPYRYETAACTVDDRIRLAPLDDTVRRWARAIYNHVVATVKYDKSGKGWGNGDIYYACDARCGNCTDCHAIFIGYACAVGIRVRFAIGFPLPAGRGAGKIARYHCWAEFCAKSIGWAPVDASEAAKNPVRREYFFGAHDENRVEICKGRDVILAPKQQGAPLNYFVYPYVELDGGRYASVDTRCSHKDLPL